MEFVYAVMHRFKSVFPHLHDLYGRHDHELPPSLVLPPHCKTQPKPKQHRHQPVLHLEKVKHHRIDLQQQTQDQSAPLPKKPKNTSSSETPSPSLTPSASYYKKLFLENPHLLHTQTQHAILSSVCHWKPRDD